MSSSNEKPRSVREENVDRTRTAILGAAQTLFATRGYAEAGVRDIAAEARVNPALIARYYGSKIELFEAALDSLLGVSIFTSIERERFGHEVASAFFETRPDAASVIPMLVFAASDSQARQVALRLLDRNVIQPFRIWFGERDAADRTAQLMAVITGFYTYRLMLPLAPLTGHPSEAMRSWLAATLQQIVDRPLLPKRRRIK